MKVYLKTNHIRIYLLILSFFLLLNCSLTGQSRPKNIILMIGDGMGTAQIYAGLTANHNTLNIERCLNIGFSKTYSADDYVTDSGAGATALSTGQKTYNHAIGVNNDSVSIPNIIELLSFKGKSTGLVVTNSVTDATPAAFVAHQPNRQMYNDIAIDYIHSPIDVFIGSGSDYFNQRDDSLNLIDSLINKGFEVYYNLDQSEYSNSKKLAVFTAKLNNPSITKGRGNMLEEGSLKAIEVLKNDPDGFFLMIEGSQIDYGCHNNDTRSLINEVLDFDKVIGLVLDFAQQDSNTLVIITADHETGGMSIVGGNFNDGAVIARFSTILHSGVMVPVFAYGPGSENFRGIYENCSIFDKILACLK